MVCMTSRIRDLLVCFLTRRSIAPSAENIWIEPEVMRHYGREDLGVALPEGGGYIGTLIVYHELHCIVRMLWILFSPCFFFVWVDCNTSK